VNGLFLSGIQKKTGKYNYLILLIKYILKTNKISFHVDYIFESASGNRLLFKEKELVARKDYHSAVSERYN